MEEYSRASGRFVDEGISSGEFSTEVEVVSRCDFSPAVGEVSSFRSIEEGCESPSAVQQRCPPFAFPFSLLSLCWCDELAAGALLFNAMLGKKIGQELIENDSLKRSCFLLPNKLNFPVCVCVAICVS